ncbi:MAG TPA: hypothetical protein VIZ69_08025 [Thermoanaerobaculia bacterium]
MPKKRFTTKTPKKPKLDDLKTRTLRERAQRKVKGGKTPSPGGPIPMPYPN